LALLVFVIGGVVGAVKLLPMAEFLSRCPRFTAWWEPVLPLYALPRMFVGHDQISPTAFRGGWLGWWEYGAFVGWITLVLAFLSLALDKKKALPFTIAGALFFLLMFGDYGIWSPWHWLHKIPPFSSLHDPVRFRIITVFCIAVMSAVAVSRQERIAAAMGNGRGGRLLYAIAGIVCVVALFELFIVSAPIYGRVSNRPALRAVREGAFRQKRLPKKEQQGPLSFLCFIENEGLVNSYNPVFPPPVGVMAYNDPGYRGEVWLLNGKGEVETQNWSPNRLRYGLKLTGSDILIVNQRYDPGWNTVSGNRVGSLWGVIAVEVSPEDKTLELYYRPPLFFAGVAISAAAVAVIGFILFRWRI
jgi:hypothetical protein